MRLAVSAGYRKNNHSCRETEGEFPLCNKNFPGDS